MQSLKSNALEPTRSELAALSRGQAILRVLPVYGLPILTILLIAFFSLLLPDSFPTAINARSMRPRRPGQAVSSLRVTVKNVLMRPALSSAPSSARNANSSTERAL